jgi:hypothetical protein
MVKAGAVRCRMVKAGAVRCHTVETGVIEEVDGISDFEWVEGDKGWAEA